MAKERGGFLILFDEAQRAGHLRDHISIEEGFSDALSSADWPLKEWEVCGLMFDDKAIAYWSLVRRGSKVATGKVRVEFIEVVATHIQFEALDPKIVQQFRRHVVSARTGIGGRVPPGSWSALKEAVNQIDHESRAALDRLERLRDQSRAPIERSGAPIVAQEKDAVGVVLDAFDESGGLRKQVLQGWSASEQGALGSFLDGLPAIEPIEDQLIWRDTILFPETDRLRPTVLGTVFALGQRKLEVFNVNRTTVERTLGVDLLYFNEEADAWTLIQYKCLEPEHKGPKLKNVYRPDPSFYSELKRMQDFRSNCPDSWPDANAVQAFRLSGDGFFFKFCYRIQLETLSSALLPGMYVPRELLEKCLEDPGTLGPRDGRQISYETMPRHISNTLFSELLREGWIGTRGISSDRVAELLGYSLKADKSVILARARPTSANADPVATLKQLGMALPTREV